MEESVTKEGEKTKFTKVTASDVAQLGMILQTCARSGDWTLSGITPDKNCRHCYGRGQLGRNVTLDIYMLCPCVLKKIQESMKFFMEIKKRIAEEKEKENGEECKEGDKDIPNDSEGKVLSDVG